jgi:hypothetical protein
VTTVRILALWILVFPASAAVRSQAPAGPAPESRTLDRVSAYVEAYYARAQRVVAEERVVIQPLRADMSADGFARRLMYELRVEWDPAGDDGRGRATVVRHLTRVGSRAPRPSDEPECTDPRTVSPEPLAFLVPRRHGEFTFRPAGAARMDGRPVLRLDFASAVDEPPVVTWRGNCVSIDLQGRTLGRVWADAETGAVVRLDERIRGGVEIPVPRPQQRAGGRPAMTVDRAESSIRYRAVTFTDPDETLMLPWRVDSVTVVRDSGSPRLRITQEFRNYRRFLTQSRIVE